MDHRSQPKLRLAAVTFAQGQLCLNRAGCMLNIKSQRQDPDILIFFLLYEHITKKLGHILKPLVSQFYSDLSVRLSDIAK